MALMDRPIPDEEMTESASVAHLPEEDDVEQESVDVSNLTAFVKSQFERAKRARMIDEQRWLKQFQNYRGVYGTETQFTETEKSRAFLKITKTKVLAAYAQVTEVLFAGGKFPVGYDTRKNPQGVAESVTYDPDAVTEEKIKKQAPGVDYTPPKRYSRPDIEQDLGILQEQLAPVSEDLVEGSVPGPKAAIFEPAKEAARSMEKKVHDQLGETNADKHLRMLAFEMALFGTGVMKGPFAYDKEYPRWTEDGEYDPIRETIPKIESRSIWSIYPDPEARTPEELGFVIDRHRLTKSQMRKLKNRPHFRRDSIELAIAYGPDYQPEHWEAYIDDNHNDPETTRYEVLEYWGVVDVELLEDSDIELPEEFQDFDEVQINVWVVNNTLIRAVVNPFKPARMPFNFVPFELNPYSVWGVGTAENMEDSQLLMNGFMRMAVDNAALSGNLIIEVDENNLVPGQDMSVYPGKVFRRQGGAPGQAIFGTKYPNVSQELLMMFDKARQLADESTGMPSYAHGMTGVGGVGRTASGMSMLMGAAATNIKAVVRNIDDYLLTPMAKAFFAFNMQFNFDEQYANGDVESVARGTESLLRNEVRSQRLLQFLQLTANPVMQAFVKYDYILRELATSMDLDEDKIINDPREAAMQASMMQEIAALMPAPPPGAQGPQGGPPAPSDPTGTGNGNIAPGAAPEPGAQGNTGAGGGANGGAPAPQPQQPPQGM